RPVVTRDAVEERRLAGAVRPDEPDRTTLVDLDRHTTQRLHTAERALDLVGPQDRCRHGRHAAPSARGRSSPTWNGAMVRSRPSNTRSIVASRSAGAASRSTSTAGRTSHGTASDTSGP